MSEMDIVWDWDDLSTDGSDEDSWSVPPFTIAYDFSSATHLFEVSVYSNQGKNHEWWNVRAYNVEFEDKEAVGESLLMLCEQRYAQENLNG
jgi:hypothetical protein